MTEQTDTTATTVHQHAELPQAHDPALNFWAVFLQYEHGVRLNGPTPALPTWKDMPYMLDKGEWVGDIPSYATSGPEFARMENKKPKIERDGRGKAKTRNVRVWQNMVSKTKRYFEDPDVAATSNKPRVIGAMLYCPNLGPAGMGQECHGVYAGIGEQMSLNMPGRPGHCPKCGDDPIQRARAIRFAYDAWSKSGLDIPSALKTAFAEVGRGD
jgi:hypothetical protein